MPVAPAATSNAMHMPVKASVISCRASTPLASAGYANKRCAPSISRAAIMTSLAMAGTAGTRLYHSRVRKDACSSVNHFFQRCTEPSRRMTNSLLALNTCVFAAQSVSGGAVTRWGIKSNAAIAAGQWWRLATPAFMHLNFMHLAVNSMALNSLGPEVEGFSGKGRFLAIYAISAVTSFAASYAFLPHFSQGSSGAIFGVAGALAVYHYRHRHMLGQRSWSVLDSLHNSLLLNLKVGMLCPRIDNWCHVGGLCGGALAAYFLGPNYVCTTQQACEPTSPVAVFARKHRQAQLVRLINGTGIRMSTHTKFRLRLLCC